MATKPKLLFYKRNQNWTENEMATLIDIWSRHLDGLKFNRRTATIYEKMAYELVQCGFNRSALELHKKVSNLIQEYRKERKKTMMGQGPSKWKFYSSVGDILQKMNTMSPQEDTSNPQPTSDGDDTRLPQPASGGGDTKKSIKVVTLYLKDQSMTVKERKPIIISMKSQAQLGTETEAVPSRTPNQQTPAKKQVVQHDLKTEMHRILEESLNLHRQQVTLHKRQVALQENMLKIMARFIDNSP